MINFSKPNNSSLYSSPLVQYLPCHTETRSTEIALYLFNITFNIKKGFKTNAVEFYKGLDGV